MDFQKFGEKGLKERRKLEKDHDSKYNFMIINMILIQIMPAREYVLFFFNMPSPLIELLYFNKCFGFGKKIEEIKKNYWQFKYKKESPRMSSTSVQTISFYLLRNRLHAA